MKPTPPSFAQGVWTLARNELHRFYGTALAYLLTAVFLGVSGFFFVLTLKASQDANMMRYVFSNTAVILLLLSPLIAMGLITEERTQKTLPLLLASPVTRVQIVLSKYLAALILLAGLLLSTLHYPLFLMGAGNPDLWPILTGYAGLFLLGSVFLAIGLWMSCLAKRPLVAASGAFGLSLVWWLLGAGPQLSDGGGNDFWAVVRYLSLGEHQDSFARGWFSLSDTLFYCSAIGILVALSVASFERQDLL